MSESIRNDIAKLLLRISLGAMFVAHGWLKVSVFTPSGTADFFASVGLPAWLAYPVIAAELIGGALILLGIGGRWISLGLVPVLLGATFVHAGNGWLFTNANGGWEYPAFLVVAALVHALIGDGRIAVVAAPSGDRTELPEPA